MPHADGSDDEEDPPWIRAFRAVHNNGTDDDEAPTITSIGRCQLRRWQQHDQSSDEEDASESDDDQGIEEDDELLGGEDDTEDKRVSVSKSMIGLSTSITPAVPHIETDASDKDAPLSPWNNKCRAKRQIWKELDDPLSAIHFLRVEQIHRKWAPRYPWHRFKSNFENMKTQTRPGEKNKNNSKSQEHKVEPWKTGNKMSKACAFLFKLFMDRTNGVQNMEKEKLWRSHKSFQDYPLNDFKGYVDKIAEKTDVRRRLVQEEEEAFRVYAISNPRRELTDRNIPFWDTHSANKLLEEDVADGAVNTMASKKELWQSRDEYQKFPLDVFRYHFYQEQRKQLAGRYWQQARNITAQKAHDKEVEEMKDEWHANIAKEVEDMMADLDLGP